MPKTKLLSFDIEGWPIQSFGKPLFFFCSWHEADKEGEWVNSPFNLDGHTLTPPVIPQED